MVVVVKKTESCLLCEKVKLQLQRHESGYKMKTENELIMKLHNIIYSL